MARTLFDFVAAAALLLAVLMPLMPCDHGAHRDASSIDQGVAYLLMNLALVLTYLIHPLDASSPYKLF
ncbi:hypothetical protein ZWY2020_005093 [Hordeum vulgare]|nr:hypothetical protein ZWY2020_005093 [Hordeum vulgare]